MNQDNGSAPKRSFTGLTFSRKPRRTVLLVDRLAERLITLSGIGGIAAVSLVGLFLLWVVLPLLLPTSVDRTEDLPRPGGAAGAGLRTCAQAADGYRSMAWTVFEDGSVFLQDLATGQVLDQTDLLGGARPLCWSGQSAGKVAFGFADGTVVLAGIDFLTEYFDDGQVPAEFRDLAQGQTTAYDRGLLSRTPEGQLRHQRLDIRHDPPLELGSSPVRLVDLTATSGGFVVAAVDSAGYLHYRSLTMKTNMLTGEVRLRSKGESTLLAELGVDRAPQLAHLKLSDTGDLALLIHTDGMAALLDRQEGGFVLLEAQDLVPDPGAGVTAAVFLAGHASLAVGDSKGGVTVWFPVLGDDGDATRLAAAHTLVPGPDRVTALAPSTRSRMLAVGYGDGTFSVFQVTAERLLGQDRLQDGAVDRITVAPREDLVIVSSLQGGGLWQLEAPYAEVSLKTLLRPVWYEGYGGPAYVWQSSAASDSSEPKMSLMPLIFGTLKATFYSLLFGLPLAVLAALYTSEFLHKRTRAKIKPVIEIMASLPSVVLGFLAALVLAPLIERVAVQVISVVVLAPFFVLLGAQFWQFLPRHLAGRCEPWRPVGILAAMVLGAVIAWQTAPWWERLAFAGDFKLWLDGQVGSGVAGWVIMLLAPSGMFMAWLNILHGERMLRTLGTSWTLQRVALADLVRFLVSVAGAFAVALFLGWLLNSAGWDPRGSVLGTYVQRNALIVGIAMGFAVIPIIYSLSEDALVSVPDHLRAASLGAGATPWQTALLVVIPPAMSGLFSAAMIGVGRAVGETMIVLMAAGNTPIMDLNIFNGFRTLSANLAVELPEAVQNSTHYRTLFLAALTLFGMTFVLNTVAEGVRLHFRKKTSQL